MTRRRGGHIVTPAATTTNGGGFRDDGKDRIAGVNLEMTTAVHRGDATANEPESHLPRVATTDEKLRSINRLPGESRSRRETRRRNPS
mmetsp:Transcript_14403/g.46978  ORF Transcript_14403/g.46978 Transcript_14403/m.46978 type:complete len:88 (+) Transcript_14403:172-435(+)